MIELDRLEILAKAATPGPWHSHGLGEVHDDPNDKVILDVCWKEEGVPFADSFSGGRQEDADYVAAANPAAILELIAEVRRLREDTARVDWLEAFHRLRANEGMSEHYGDTGTALVERTSDGWMLDREVDRDQPEFETLREAIDAARTNNNPL